MWGIQEGCWRGVQITWEVLSTKQIGRHNTRSQVILAPPLDPTCSPEGAVTLRQLGIQTSTGEAQGRTSSGGEEGSPRKQWGHLQPAAALGKEGTVTITPWSWPKGWQGRAAGTPESACDMPGFPNQRLSPRPICLPQAASKSLGSLHMPCNITCTWNLKYGTSKPIYKTEKDSQIKTTKLRLPSGGGRGMK